MTTSAAATPSHTEASSIAHRMIARMIRVPPSYYVFVVLLAIIWIHKPNQIDVKIMGIFFRDVAPLGIVVLGQLVVMRARSIDLSGAGVILLVNYYFASGIFESPVAVVATIGILTGLVVGMVNGLLIGLRRSSAVLVTLAVNTILIGIVRHLAGGKPPGAIPDVMNEIYRTGFLSVPTPVILWVGLTLVMSMFLSQFVYGRYVSAVGANPIAARFSGVPVERTVVVAHMISGLMAGIAAVVQASSVKVGSIRFGLDLPLDAVAATILGGVVFGKGEGGVRGPFFGVLSFALLFVVLRNFEVPEAGRWVARGLIILLAAGIYGIRTATKS